MKLGACGLAAAAAVVLTGTEASAQVTDGLELGLQTFSYEYKEEFDGGSIKDEGRFTGFVANYGRPVGGFSFDARFHFAEGEIDYSASDGARLDGVQQTVAALELLAGRSIAASPTLTITPFVGLGSRVLLDESGGREADDGAAGYDREVGHVYIPLGAAARFSREDGGSVVVHGQYNAVVGGRVRSDLSQIDREFPILENAFDGGHGLEFGAMLYSPFRGGRIGVGPVFRSWNIDQSKTVTFSDESVSIEFFEPPSKTVEVGLKLTYGF
jgi:hypothetical protein